MDETVPGDFVQQDEIAATDVVAVEHGAVRFRGAPCNADGLLGRRRAE